MKENNVRPLKIVIHALRIQDLDKRNLVKPIFTTAAAASKYDTRFKSGQSWLENNHLASLVYIRDTCSTFGLRQTLRKPIYIQIHSHNLDPVGK